VRRTASPITVALVLGVILCLTGCLHARPSVRSAAASLASGTAPLKTVSQWLDQAQVDHMTTARWAVIARRSSVVVLNSWNFRLIPILKQANPQVRVWVYKDLSGVRSDDCTTSSGTCGDCRHGTADSKFLSSGMGYCWTIRHDPRWLLLSSLSGRPFQFRHYAHIWATDYGSQAYQRQWIRNVVADVRAHGWDGVTVDNALTTANAYGVAAKYPSDRSVQTATYSALRTIGKGLRKAGIPSVFNVGYATRFPGLWQRWLQPVRGLEQEFYLGRSETSNAIGAAWRMYEQEISSCVDQNKSCWFNPGGVQAWGTSQYALASYLIAASGKQVLGVRNTASLDGPCWQLGPAEGPRQRLGSAWRRFFRGGVAVVNPTATRLEVPLGGWYLDRGGRAVATVTLEAATGSVLRTSREGQAEVTRPATPGLAVC
jgi:hypothetical protein